MKNITLSAVALIASQLLTANIANAYMSDKLHCINDEGATVTITLTQAGKDNLAKTCEVAQSNGLECTECLNSGGPVTLMRSLAPSYSDKETFSVNRQTRILQSF